MCASPAYLAGRGTPRVPEDLLQHDCIINAGLPSLNLWVFARDNAEIGIPVRPRLVVPNVEAACDAASAGIGIARALFHHIAASVGAGTLVTVLDDFQLLTVPVSFVYAAGRFLSIKVRAFLDFAAPRLKAQLARDGAHRSA